MTLPKKDTQDPFADYRRGTEIETDHYNVEWNVKRIIAKANYQIHTEAVKTWLVPISTKWKKELEYAEEADLLNIAIFGCTAKDWRLQNAGHPTSQNIRDTASLNELVVLCNLESMNAKMIRDGVEKQTRFEQLQKEARYELEFLSRGDVMKTLKRSWDGVYPAPETGRHRE